MTKLLVIILAFFADTSYKTLPVAVTETVRVEWAKKFKPISSACLSELNNTHWTAVSDTSAYCGKHALACSGVLGQGGLRSWTIFVNKSYTDSEEVAKLLSHQALHILLKCTVRSPDENHTFRAFWGAGSNSLEEKIYTSLSAEYLDFSERITSIRR